MSIDPPVPASDAEREEREELADELDEDGRHLAEVAFAMRCNKIWKLAARVIRAAALLRQPAPVAVPVAVAERPWERKGWRDTDGRCWWFNRAGIPEWQLTDGGSYGDFSLPANALPVPDHQPPQGGDRK